MMSESKFAWQCTRMGYLPFASAIGLSDDEFPQGIGFVECTDGVSKATRVGDATAVLRIAVADGRLTGPEALALFPYVRPGWITEVEGVADGSA